jgi:hypothetical protein
MRKRKYLPQNPYHHHHWVVLYPRTSGDVIFTHSDGHIVTTTYRGSAKFFGADVEVLDTVYPGDDPSNKAIQKLQSRVSLSSGDAGVTVAEAHKTAAMVAQTATKIAKAIRELRKGHLGDFSKTLGLTTSISEIRAYRNQFRRKRASGSDLRQFASNSWLEYSYGWKPLLSDVYNQAENLARLLHEHEFVLHEATASARMVRNYSADITPTGTWRHQKNVEVRRKVRYTVRYAVPNGANTVGNVFGLQNPALVAWELVPFSFVADWFLPIGNFLEGLTAYNGLVFHSGTKTESKEYHATCLTRPGSKQSGNPTVLALGPTVESTNNIYKKDRSVLSAFPSQRFPEFKSPVSFAHAASAIALLQAITVGSRKGTYVYR